MRVLHGRARVLAPTTSVRLPRVTAPQFELFDPKRGSRCCSHWARASRRKRTSISRELNSSRCPTATRVRKWAADTAVGGEVKMLISLRAAQVKHIESPVTGDADIMVVPELESGDMLANGVPGRRHRSGPGSGRTLAGRPDEPCRRPHGPGAFRAAGADGGLQCTPRSPARALVRRGSTDRLALPEPGPRSRPLTPGRESDPFATGHPAAPPRG